MNINLISSFLIFSLGMTFSSPSVLIYLINIPKPNFISIILISLSLLPFIKPTNKGNKVITSYLFMTFIFLLSFALIIFNNFQELSFYMLSVIIYYIFFIFLIFFCEKKILLLFSKTYGFLIISFSLVGFFIHNILNLPPLLSIRSLDSRTFHFLIGTISTSTQYLSNLSLFRISGIYNEPSSFAFFCFIFILINLPNRRNSIAGILGLISSLSLGGYIALLFILKKITFVVTKSFNIVNKILIVSGILLVFLYFNRYTFLIFRRLNFGSGIIQDDNRVFEYSRITEIFSAPLLVDRISEGGYDNLFDLLDNTGLLNLFLTITPLLLCVFILFKNKKFGLSIGLFSFIFHKLNILTPHYLVLFAVLLLKYSNENENENEVINYKRNSNQIYK